MGNADAVGALLVRDGQVLLGLRAAHRRSYPSCWDVIGGHLEAGETIFDALARELSEEIGVTPTQADPLGNFLFKEGGHEKILSLFRVDRWNGVPFMRDAEHEQLSWFQALHAAALPNLALPAYADVLRALAQTA